MLKQRLLSLPLVNSPAWLLTILLTNDMSSLITDESNFSLSHHAFKSCVNQTPSVAFFNGYWKGNVFFQWMTVDLAYLPDSVDRGAGCFGTDQSSEM